MRGGDAIGYAASFRLKDLVLCLRPSTYFERGDVAIVTGRNRVNSRYIKLREKGGFNTAVDASDFVKLQPGQNLPLQESA